MNQYSVDSQMLYRAQESMARWFSRLFASKGETAAEASAPADEHKAADAASSGNDNFFYDDWKALCSMETRESRIAHSSRWVFGKE